MEVTGLSPERAFGRTITGLTAADISDKAIVQQLHDIWIEHGLIVFRDGQCDPDFHVELSVASAISRFTPLQRCFTPSAKSCSSPPAERTGYFWR